MCRQSVFASPTATIPRAPPTSPASFTAAGRAIRPVPTLIFRKYRVASL